MESFYLYLLGLSSVVKFLLIPSYRSTDFEVHRNWLAITHSLPVSKWYFEKTSEWTLDYPPFFAWFEYSLSCIANIFDPQMLALSNLAYSSKEAIIFQRLSVIASELFYFWAVTRVFRNVQMPMTRYILVSLTFLNPGLLFVDHVHFQYNGFLFGFLIFSIAAVLEERNLLAAFLFSVLINFKHIYLYLAPSYFIYLLRHYCFRPSGFRFKNFAKLAGLTLSVFAVSLAPFVYQLPQLLSRLFPFKRGLTHAYWAPNFWALYSFLDRALLRLVGGTSIGGDTGSLTRGLVGDTKFVILPQVPPLATLVLTVAAMLPSLWKLWRTPSGEKFINSVILCGWSSFLFGWHVHEKAILMVTIPFCLVATKSSEHARVFELLSISAYYSLFPLLFQGSELPIKISIYMLYILLSILCVSHIVSPGDGRFWAKRQGLLLYACGLVCLELLTTVQRLAFPHKWEFLSLMLTSVYCALGIVAAWFRFYVLALKA